MSATVQELFRSFEALPESEKHELASAILRWSGQADHPPLTDDELVRAADALFVTLDEREERGGQSIPR